MLETTIKPTVYGMACFDRFNTKIPIYDNLIVLSKFDNMHNMQIHNVALILSVQFTYLIHGKSFIYIRQI